MVTNDDFPPLPARKLRDPATTTTSMDTELPLPTSSDVAKCERMLTIHESILLQQDQLLLLEQTLMRIRTGRIRKTQPNYDQLTREVDDLTRKIKILKGELALLGSHMPYQLPVSYWT
ncbi:hypothetical protein TNIN_271061 [Trichonephila inaurata madagascariensis]|uniref:Uncharacterized protein n=1 Tax=Trichonephila inaurata madagascariensis TaxID=2747483 RepID=A0A8X6WLF7_9ARAC|nr:hypothetical protein TNIN_271061 [Trichonephila inaurata madagascariensis]